MQSNNQLGHCREQETVFDKRIIAKGPIVKIKAAL